MGSIHLANKVARQSDYYKEHLNNNNISIQINIPESIIYKDGPSAGLAFIIGIMAEFMSKRIPHDVAFTGELSLEGRILPIGGLKEKLIAAYVNGIKTVYIPEKNFAELIYVQNRIKSSLNIKLVEHYEDVIEDMWAI
jgi:ATP-dependent Lon protease